MRNASSMNSIFSIVFGLSVLQCTLLGQEDGKASIARILIEAGRLELVLGGTNPHVLEIGDRAAFLSLAPSGYKEEHIRRLVENKRADLLCVSLVQLVTHRCGRSVSGTSDDLHTRIVLVALRSIHDSRSLPYLVYAQECLSETMKIGSDTAVETAVMLYHLDAALRQLSARDGEEGPPLVEDFSLLPPEERQVLRMVGHAGWSSRRDSLEKARKVLEADKFAADGWTGRGKEFCIPSHERRQ